MALVEDSSASLFRSWILRCSVCRISLSFFSIYPRAPFPRALINPIALSPSHSCQFYPSCDCPPMRPIRFEVDIIGTVKVLKPNSPPSNNLFWCVVVFLFPVLGLIVYWLFSNREAHMGSGSYKAIPWPDNDTQSMVGGWRARGRHGANFCLRI